MIDKLREYLRDFAMIGAALAPIIYFLMWVIR